MVCNSTEFILAKQSPPLQPLSSPNVLLIMKKFFDILLIFSNFAFVLHLLRRDFDDVKKDVGKLDYV